MRKIIGVLTQSQFDKVVIEGGYCINSLLSTTDSYRSRLKDHAIYVRVTEPKESCATLQENIESTTTKVVVDKR
jgi:hypothetical protein